MQTSIRTACFTNSRRDVARIKSVRLFIYSVDNFTSQRTRKNDRARRIICYELCYLLPKSIIFLLPKNIFLPYCYQKIFWCYRLYYWSIEKQSCETYFLLPIMLLATKLIIFLLPKFFSTVLLLVTYFGATNYATCYQN